MNRLWVKATYNTYRCEVRFARNGAQSIRPPLPSRILHSCVASYFLVRPRPEMRKRPKRET